MSIPPEISSQQTGFSYDKKPESGVKRKITDMKAARSFKSFEVPSMPQVPELFVELPEGLPQHISDRVKKRCLQDYAEALDKDEQALSQTCETFLDPVSSSETQGPLLRLVDTFANRYLDLLEAYVAYEQFIHLPSIASPAGLLISKGLTKEDILSLVPISDVLFTCLQPYQDVSESVIKGALQEVLTSGRMVLTDEDPAGSQKTMIKQSLIRAFKEYGISEKEARLLQRLFDIYQSVQSMHPFMDALYEISRVKTDNAPFDERLLREIRYRMGDAGLAPSKYTGSVGQNPLSYRNAVRKDSDGTAKDRRAKFRIELFFVETLARFSDELCSNAEFRSFAQKYLEKHGKNWVIEDVIAERLSQFPRPVFRQYGAYAGVSQALRAGKPTQEEKERFAQKFTQPTFASAPGSRLFGYDLSERELIALAGERELSAIPKDRKVPFESGAVAYHMLSEEEIRALPDSPQKKAALEYVLLQKSQHLPTAAGISGSLDIVFTMAGLVGIGVDPAKGMYEKQLLRMGILGSYLTARHHTALEVMQSSKTFGMDFDPARPIEEQVFPLSGDVFKERLSKTRTALGLSNPRFFLRTEHAKHVAQRILKDEGAS